MADTTKRGCPCGRGPAIGTRSPRAWHFYCSDCGATYEEAATLQRAEPIPREERAAYRPPVKKGPRRAA